jgi:hypothetical protein
MLFFFVPDEYPKWFIFSPNTKLWAKANQTMAQSLLLMMDMQPHLYEGWKVCRVDDPKQGDGD